jgi:hypothetical protein
VPTTSPEIFVEPFLRLFANSFDFPIPNASGSADFSDTGTLLLTLPDGFTFTSDTNNGVIPVATAVPEPSTLALFTSALALLALGRVRRCRGKQA